MVGARTYKISICRFLAIIHTTLQGISQDIASRSVITILVRPFDTIISIYSQPSTVCASSCTSRQLICGRIFCVDCTCLDRISVNVRCVCASCFTKCSPFAFFSGNGRITSFVCDLVIFHNTRSSTYRFCDFFTSLCRDIYTVFGDLHFIITHLIGHRFGTFIGHIFRSISDGAVFRGIGDIRRGHFRLRLLTVLPNHRFCDTIPFLLGIALVTVFVLRIAIDAFAILASGRGIPLFISQCILRFRRGLGEGIVIALGVFGYIFHSISGHVGSGFFPISSIALIGIGSRTFFIMSECAFCCDTIPIGYFSSIRNTIRRDGGSTVILFTG